IPSLCGKHCSQTLNYACPFQAANRFHAQISNQKTQEVHSVAAVLEEMRHVIPGDILRQRYLNQERRSLLHLRPCFLSWRVKATVLPEDDSSVRLLAQPSKFR